MLKKAKDFQMPKKLQYDPKKISDTYGKFTAEPLERGFRNNPRQFVAACSPFIAGRIRDNVAAHLPACSMSFRASPVS